MSGHNPRNKASRQKPRGSPPPKRPDDDSKSTKAPAREPPPTDKFEERGPIGGYGGAGPDEHELE